MPVGVQTNTVTSEKPQINQLANNMAKLSTTSPTTAPAAEKVTAKPSAPATPTEPKIPPSAKATPPVSDVATPSPVVVVAAAAAPKPG